MAGLCWWWRKSWKRGVRLGGEGGCAAEEELGWISWKKGFVGGGFGRIRGKASLSAIGGENRILRNRGFTRKMNTRQNLGWST